MTEVTRHHVLQVVDQDFQIASLVTDGGWKKLWYNPWNNRAVVRAGGHETFTTQDLQAALDFYNSL